MKLKSNEYFSIEFFECNMYDIDLTLFEQEKTTYRSWDSLENNIPNNCFKDIKDCLTTVLKLNGLKYKDDIWKSYGLQNNKDYGRFDYATIVDDYGNELDQNNIPENKKTFELRITVRICIKKDLSKNYLNNLKL